MNVENGSDDQRLVFILRDKIDEIERSVHEFEELGKGLPMVEKNVRSLHGILYVLKQDISSVAEALESRACCGLRP